MATKDKLSKRQVYAIPKLLEKKSIGEVARQYGVTWQTIFYWVKRLRETGMEIKTRPPGNFSKIITKVEKITKKH